MREVTDLAHAVQVESLWITIDDGIRLAARVWRPVDSDTPVPAIVEAIPYRQGDLTVERDSIHHPYLAGHGYAGVRLDLRGSGNSEGVLTGEYLERELQDIEQVLAWLAEQPWCNGSTGLMGISWGGFNALQVAARRPPSLGAVVAVAATDDRYADDVHYMGGCLLSDNLSWASTMFAYNSSPPDPDIVGDGWRELWLDRLRDSGLWLNTWLEHQHRDAFWEHGSICENYQDVDCPVLAVSGWADGYSNAVFRLCERLPGPRMGLIGPWSHKYPHLGQPGPAIGFLQELVRWWDRWLKKITNGIDEEPMLRVWMQDSVPPSTAYQERPGRWVGEPSWPSPHVVTSRLPLVPGRIAAPGTDVANDTVSVTSPLSVGQFAGKWCSYNAPPDLPYDQREEDGGSLTFDTVPLEERYEILGAAVVTLDLSVDRPVAMVAARLSDLAPDGRATRVTYGLLNLTHRDGHDRPEPLQPDTHYRVAVTLNGVAHAFAAGHRIRLALSTSYWPLAWPPPQPVHLQVHTGSSHIAMPVRPVAASDEVGLRPFEQPEGCPPTRTEALHPGDQRWEVTRDLVDYRSALEVIKDLGTVRFPDTGLEVRRSAQERYSSRADEMESAAGETVWQMGFRRGDWDVRTRTLTRLTCSDTAFRLYAELDAFEGEERVYSRTWQRTILRDNV